MPSNQCLGRNLFAFLFLLIITGCGNPGEKKCNPSLADDYKKLDGKADITLQDVYSNIGWYDSIPDICHEQVAASVINDLFSVVYAHQTYDTVIIPFLDKISKEKDLSVQNQSRAVLKIASYHLYGQQDVDKTMPYIEVASKNLDQMNDSVKKVYYSLNGEICVRQSKLKEATNWYMKSIAICEKIKDSAALAATLSNYSTIYSKMREYKKAAEIKKQSLQYFINHKNYDYLIYGYIGVGTEYGFLKNYDSAIHYFLLGIDLIENKGVVNPNIAYYLYSNIAGIYLGLVNFDKATYYYSKAKEQLSLLKNRENEKTYIMASSAAFAAVRPVDTEIKIINGYLDEYKKANDYHGMIEANYALHHIYFVRHDYHKSLSHLIRYDSLKSQIGDEENTKYVAEMETKYETQKKQMKIEVQQKEIKKQRAITALLVAVILVLCLATALFFARIKLKRNKREAELQQQFTRKLMENTEEERIRIARDLHDGVSQELMILKNQMSDENTAHKQKIDTIINEIRLISRDLHPVMLEKIGLKASVEHICNQLMEANMIFISSEIDYDSSLDKNGELQMFRMIQEALNNIIKYSQAQAAKVSINESAKYVVAEIIDNGNGFDVEAAMNSKNSFGLLNLKERSKALNGKTSISSSTSGTKIKIEIPKLK
jgi:two-component system, NarL family, sensor kinase